MKIRQLFNIFLLNFILFGILAISAQAQLDKSFGTNGIVSPNIAGADKPLASYLLPNGKILVVNSSFAGTNPTVYRFYFVRFNANGTLDTSYGTNGVVTVLGANAQPLIESSPNCARQSDGKILLTGSQSVYRFNENGTLDPTFSGDGIHTPNVDQQASEKLAAVIQQPDGKIIVAGTIFGNFGSPPSKIFFVRYQSNGDLDPSFGDQAGFIINTVQYTTISDIALQSNGKILTVPQKEINEFSFYWDGAINRFNANGTIDNNFSPQILQRPCCSA